jgi:hypothetical protein
MSPRHSNEHPLVFDSEAGPGVPQKYTLDQLRDMKPIGASLPVIPEDFPDAFTFRSRVVDAAPKPPGTVRRLLDAVRSTSPAEQAYRKADVHPFEGVFYCTSPEGEIVETTVRRKGHRFGLGFGGNEGEQLSKWAHAGRVVNSPGMS